MAVPEAPLRTTRHGLAPDGEGWFVLDARASRWRDYGPLGLSCAFEGKRPFRELGVNLNVLPPGAPLGLYHRERHQEGFLVLDGECLAVVEGEERRLGAWDFLHSPGGTAHVLVGAGEGGAVVLAVGARGGRKGVVYLVDEAARRHGACAERETTDYREAYARFPPPVRVRAPELPDLGPPPDDRPAGPRVRSPYFGLAYIFEEEGDDYPEVGYTLAVLEPGRPSGLYHAETAQEDFLVLSGECIALVEGEERPLRRWDFLHCPPATEHILVCGDEPAVVFMTGSRPAGRSIVYPRSELALRHGAGVERETTEPREAYAPFPNWAPI